MALSLASLGTPRASAAGTNGLASWYGEEHRGKLMANGHRFNPDRLTAASWFYPLGAKVQVTLASAAQPPRSVVVTITDRGPAWEYVREGRTIDLSRASFAKLGHPRVGLLAVAVQPVNPPGANVQVSVASSPEPPRSVVATNTDRGPAWAFMPEGPTLGLSGASFKQFDHSDLNLFAVAAQPAR
jgi:rare lipoprotein A